MIIGFDAKRAFHNHTGLGNYSRTLIKNLQTLHPDEKYVYFTPRTNTSYSKLFDARDVITPSGTKPLWRSFGIKKEIKQAGVDVFHGLSNELPIGINKTGVPSVVTIHDVIFDIIKEDFPWHDRVVYKLKTQKAIQESTKIIAISEATKQDLIGRFDAIPDKISVIYQPIDIQFQKENYHDESLVMVKKKYNLPPSFLLYVGAFMKRKNVLPMIKAWQKLPKDHRIPFFIFGNGREYKKEVMDYISKNHLGKWMHILPPVPFEELPMLYRLADSVVYPSRYEGFGLPVLEALACGARVVTSSVSSMPEAGGDLPVYVDPGNIESISEGIRKSLEQSRPDAVKLSDHLARFNPRKLTEQVVELYREVGKK